MMFVEMVKADRRGVRVFVGGVVGNLWMQEILTSNMREKEAHRVIASWLGSCSCNH